MKRVLSRWAYFFALTASILFSTPAWAQVNAEQVLAIGRNVLSMEDYMLSIQYFNLAIKAKPYLADPYYFRALAKLSLEDYAGAEQDCSLAIERNKFKIDSYKLRGFARQYLGKDSLAIEDYNIGLGYNPQDKYFLFYKSVAQTEIKDYAGADSTFSTLLRLYPRFDDGHTAHARLNIVRGDTVSALADLDRALAVSPNSLQALAVRAELMSRQRRWEQALEDIDRLITLRPREGDMYVNRAFVRYNLDDWFGAMADYNYALELEPDNVGARYNRALLRYEVRDLDRAATDLEGVLSSEPDNFHAMYNLGLINLERGKARDALMRFRAIAARYPRFYPVYYAEAEALRDLGDMRSAMQCVHTADEMVRGYVTNPERNPLDRPVVSRGDANVRHADKADQSAEEVMEEFNRLVTVAAPAQTTLSFNERIKGRVQDRDISAEPEPAYALSFVESPASLRSSSYYFRQLDDFNTRRYIADKLYLAPGQALPSDEADLNALFDLAERYEKLCAGSNPKPADLLALGVARSMLRDYDAAERVLTRALDINHDFTPALMARAYVRGVRGDSKALTAAVADYDEAFRIDPMLVYAVFNKGCLLYAAGDYTSALQCFTQAAELDPAFGQAFYNRGLTYLRLGNRQQAFADLSKAGELGVIPSYNILKRLK